MEQGFLSLKQEGQQSCKMLCVPHRKEIPFGVFTLREQNSSLFPSSAHTPLPFATHPHAHTHLGIHRGPVWSCQCLHHGAQRVLLRGDETWCTHMPLPMPLLLGNC